jgi:hypothetical protein
LNRTETRTTGTFGPRRENDRRAVGKFETLQVREHDVREVLDDRRTGLAIDRGGRRRPECALRAYFECVVPALEPASRGVAQVLGARARNPVERRAIAGRIGFVDLAGREHVGLAAKAADAFEPLDESSPDRSLRAFEFHRRRALVEKATQLLLDRCLDPRRIDILLHVGVDAEQARDLERRLTGVDRVGQALAINQPLIQTRSLAAAQDFRHETQVVGVRGAVRRCVPEPLPARLRDLVVQDLAPALGPRRDPDARSRQRRARRDVAEIALHLVPRGRDVDVAGQHEYCIGRPVIRLEPVAHVL